MKKIGIFFLALLAAFSFAACSLQPPEMGAFPD